MDLFITKCEGLNWWCLLSHYVFDEVFKISCLKA